MKNDNIISFKQLKTAALISDTDLLNIKSNLPVFTSAQKGHEKVVEVFKVLDQVAPGFLLGVDQISELADIFDIFETRKAIQRARKVYRETFGKCLYNRPRAGYKVANDNEALEEHLKGIKRGTSHFNNARSSYRNCKYKYLNLTEQQKKDQKMIELLTELVDVICNHQNKNMLEAMDRMKIDFGNKLSSEKKKEER